MLVRAQESNISDLIKYINNITATGTTNYINAFEKAFEMLKRTYEAELSTNTDILI